MQPVVGYQNEKDYYDSVAWAYLGRLDYYLTVLLETGLLQEVHIDFTYLLVHFVSIVIKDHFEVWPGYLATHAGWHSHFVPGVIPCYNA